MKFIIKELITLLLAVFIFSLILNTQDKENILSMIQIIGVTLFIYLFVYALKSTFDFLLNLIIGDNKLEITFNEEEKK